MAIPNVIRRRILGGALAAGGAALLGSTGPAWATGAGTYPARPVRVVVPYPAGGVVDLAARIVTDHIAAQWQQPLVVENRPGANGNIGAAAVKAAEPDGHTLLVGSMFLVLNPLIDPQVRFATADFEPVASLGATPNLLVVPASSPYASVSELVAGARERAGALNTPNPGVGSSNHLGLELFLNQAGLDVVQVGYKGQPPFIQDLVSGRLDFAYVTAALALPLVESGMLRPLAVASGHRLTSLPEVETLVEAGYGDGAVLPWNGLFTPAGTPAAVRERIAAAVEAALRDPVVIERYRGMQAELPQAPRELAQFVHAEQQRWQGVVDGKAIAFASL